MKYFNFWTSGFCACSAMTSFMNHNILVGIAIASLSLVNLFVGVMTND